MFIYTYIFNFYKILRIRVSIYMGVGGEVFLVKKKNRQLHIILVLTEFFL